MIAASLLVNGITTLNNIPDILDVQTMLEIIKGFNIKVKRENHKITIDTTNIQEASLNFKLISSIRASVVLVGPLLARYGRVIIPHPGGDKIGKRPIDRHIDALKQLGCNVSEHDNLYEFSYEKLKNDTVSFDKITVAGTENLLLFSSLINKKITINNCAIEPEILDLADYLKKIGVHIQHDGRTFVVEGNTTLKATEHSIISDRLEAGTFACLAAATGSEIKINNCPIHYLNNFLNALKKIGVNFETGDNFLYIKKSSKLQSFDVSTAEYPGLSTDLHPPLGVLLTQAHGTSEICENIFENRLGYLNELKTMGANIEILDKSKAKIYGPTKLHGANIHSLDIRAGATLIIAGLIANGETIIENAEIIDRGYEKIEDRLSQIGADIKRVM
ncbi:MAG: UDP-N-acetylglucosamine 1-carboxyvinyltransferase 1, UDP-N-acetylglucosamine [Candidatus Berkelbacteria bacterium]|nr:UDP-N-acetylglucosamine 1-carboxyvinyltransferase 1, UDP-N-acetylglucosamine [Candidatus Berkelbacteria bacterium]